MEFGGTKLYLIVCIVLMPHVWPRTPHLPWSCLVTRYTRFKALDVGMEAMSNLRCMEKI